MKLLLDTNIIVDVLSRRDGYEESLNILRCCEVRRAEGCITTATIMDVMYILRKHMEPSEMKEAVQTILTIVDVVEIREADIRAAFGSDMTDFEDAVQAFCAQRNKVDTIVTRNKKDFVKSPVPAMLPGEILSLIGG
jgi:predicted nucleic acid-binding protein